MGRVARSLAALAFAVTFGSSAWTGSPASAQTPAPVVATRAPTIPPGALPPTAPPGSSLTGPSSGGGTSTTPGTGRSSTGSGGAARNAPPPGAPLGVGPATALPAGAAEATATVGVALQLTAVAAPPVQIATAPAQPVAPANPTPAAAPTLAPTATPPPAATIPPTPTALPSITPTPNPLASTRTVITTAPIAVGDETLAPGAPLDIPVDTRLEDNAIPPGTPLRLPGGQVITLPAGTRIPAVENPTVVGAPLNAVLQRTSAVGDTTYAPGTAIVLPSGSSVLGGLEPGATVLLPADTIVQVAGRTQTLREPVAVTIGGAPASRPASLPATGDADPIWWPAALGVLLALLGWRLRHAR